MAKRAESIAFIDDQFVPISEAKISILEPTFTKSDVVYDTLSSWKGYMFRLDEHLERFQNSYRAMQLKPPYPLEEIRRIVAECIERSGFEDTCVTLMATRGPFIDLADRDIRKCKNGLIAVCVPYYWVLGEAKQTSGVNMVITENQRVPAGAIDARVKNFNWMDLTRGLLEAYEKGGDSALLCTPDGLLSEGPGFNIWLAKDGKLFTPRGNLLEGVTRRSVFELAQEMGAEPTEKPLRPDDLRGADEAFTSTTAGGITPVTQVDGKTLGNGAPGILTMRLNDEYWRRRKDGWHGTRVEEVLRDRDVA
ncbi:MAG: branched-chain amino acid transferase [Rhodospirillaceae bacterium]|jgi:branched-chain amino acid aminotransferase|nr:branched-chain amino acid transferase [Rhodospirillaceae bacterium]MBT6830426.1 branched-chain amino acid transferase [Rhodospirillaceae bacterium]